MRKLKAERKLTTEWWELWFNKPGERPVFIRMYGEAVPHWIPDGCFPSRELALATKRDQGNRYIRVYRIRRYATSGSATGEKKSSSL